MSKNAVAPIKVQPLANPHKIHFEIRSKPTRLLLDKIMNAFATARTSSRSMIIIRCALSFCCCWIALGHAQSPGGIVIVPGVNPWEEKAAELQKALTESRAATDAQKRRADAAEQKATDANAVIVRLRAELAALNEASKETIDAKSTNNRTELTLIRNVPVRVSDITTITAISRVSMPGLNLVVNGSIINAHVPGDRSKVVSPRGSSCYIEVMAVSDQSAKVDYACAPSRVERRRR